MKRRRLYILLALSILAPAALLAVLAFRALRADEVLRVADERKRAEVAIHTAAIEVQLELETWLRSAREALREQEQIAVLGPDGEPCEAATFELATTLARERPDLASALAQIESREHADRVGAHMSYVGLAAESEHPGNQARLLARAARCPRDTALLERLAHEYADIRSESGIPLGIVARLQLIELGGDRDTLGHEILERLPAEWPIERIVAERLNALGVSCANCLEHARIAERAIAWAHAKPSEETAWFGRWVALHQGDRLYLLSAPLPKLQELSQLSGLCLAVQTESSELSASIVDGLYLASELPPATGTRTRPLLVGSMIILLILMIGVALVITLRSVHRELRLAQLKSDFAATVSHELRTPLTSVRMFSELLSKVEEPKRQEYIEIIQRETARLSHLVEKILDFARLERGDHVFSFELCDLRDVLGAAVRNFHPARTNFTVRFEPPHHPVRASVDPQALEQAIHNLLDNAAKYAPETHEAEIRLLPGERVHRIEVHDDGPGLNPDEADAVFEKFHRGKNPQTLEVPGTGLGLALVRQIAHAHRGHAHVESAKKGCTFVIEIPARCGSTSSAIASSAPASPYR